MPKKEDKELAKIVLPGIQVPVREGLVARLKERFCKTDLSVKFEAVSIDEDPETEALKATIAALNGSISTAYGVLRHVCPGLTHEDIRANCFRFCCLNARRGTLGELVPVDEGNVNFTTHSDELRTRWQLSEDVGAVEAFTKRKCWSLDRRLLNGQARFVIDYGNRTNADIKWVINVPILDEDSKLPLGVVSLDSLKTEIPLEHLKLCHDLLPTHADAVASAWNTLKRSAALIGTRKA